MGKCGERIDNHAYYCYIDSIHHSNYFCICVREEERGCGGGGRENVWRKTNRVMEKEQCVCVCVWRMRKREQVAGEESAYHREGAIVCV